MILRFLFVVFLFTMLGCKSLQKNQSPVAKADYTIAFGSCADQDRPQPLWTPILQNNPDVFIWGGDNIYADTADMAKMEADYEKTKVIPAYKKLLASIPVEGAWDDHDYGKNDAGAEWEYKEEAQQLYLDFLDVPQSSPRRVREGIYYAKNLFTQDGIIKLIVLDTRYFRSPLKPSDVPNERYQPWDDARGGTILGEEQWQWLESQLQDNTPSFTVIVSSIQFLAKNHGWEKWGNHPAEVKKMEALLANANAPNILFLSGDRHHAEISKANIEGLDYPLLDITSSGLTHTFPDTPFESNPYRVGEGTKALNFCILKFDFENKKMTIEIRGTGNQLLSSYTQSY